MPKFFTDLHVHSSFSKWTSKYLGLEHVARQGERKGIRVLSCADITHPAHLRILKNKLVEDGRGMFRLKDGSSSTLFMLTTEVHCSCSWNEKGRRTHLLLFCPSFEVVDKINKVLKMFGNLKSDGRPTLLLAPKFFVKYVMDISSDCMVIPAHILTPWYGLLGSKAGYDSMEECFEEETKNIYAVETGLSADPNMVTKIFGNKYSIVSWGDGHSLNKIGRELTAFDCELDYYEITKHIKEQRQLFTVEFFPQMGKYFLSGHRDCRISMFPEEAHGHQVCPKCSKRWTQGVLYRTWKLGGKHEVVPPKVKYTMPLRDIISTLHDLYDEYTDGRFAFRHYALNKLPNKEYEEAIDLATEMNLLLGYSNEGLGKLLPDRIANAIIQVRNKDLIITPGYDGLFGKVKFKGNVLEKDIKKEIR